LIAQEVITVDTIKYDTDQSATFPKFSFAPPIGSATVPDSLFPWVINFPNVAEEMMPSSGGTSLAAFLPGGTQNLSFSWTKNHPWGYNPNAYKYDSLLPGEHITVFIQTPLPIPSFGIAEHYVLQSASKPISVVTGIQELRDGIYVELYPNPTTGDATIQFDLYQEQNVSVELFNTLGQKVYFQNEGVISTGHYIRIIPAKGLSSGVYFVKLTTDNAVIIKKLVIQK
jgi:hypothetical protein